MPKPKLSATTTVVQTTTVALKAHVKQMLKTRIEEHARLAAEITEKESRQKRIRQEVEEMFAKEGQTAALEAGTEIDGHKVKLVKGNTTTLDKVGLMQAVGLTPDELNAFYESKPKKPYIKISKAGERDEE